MSHSRESRTSKNSEVMPKCKGTTKTGKQCENFVGEKDFCWIHLSESHPRCDSAGCPNLANRESSKKKGKKKLCWYHIEHEKGFFSEMGRGFQLNSTRVSDEEKQTYDIQVNQAAEIERLRKENNNLSAQLADLKKSIDSATFSSKRLSHEEAVSYFQQLSQRHMDMSNKNPDHTYEDLVSADLGPAFEKVNI